MSSASIYTPIKPTYLYIKQHSVTGLKYFGKTTETDPYKYSGSGGYWKNHIKKHGKKFIKTIWVSDLYYDTSIVEHALHFSIENNIVESNDWANLILENGLDGAITGTIRSKESRIKQSVSAKGRNAWNKGKQDSDDIKIKKSNSHKGKTPWNKGKICNPQPIVTCPRCNKTGGASNMKRYHFDNCKLK